MPYQLLSIFTFLFAENKLNKNVISKICLFSIIPIFLMYNYKKEITNYFSNRITIDKKQHKTVFAIKKFLYENLFLCDKLNNLDVKDTSNSLIFDVPEGCYSISYDNKNVNILYETENITISCWSNNSIDFLKKFITDIYEKYNKKNKVAFYYTHSGDKWNFPITRRHYDISLLERNSKINNFLNNVEKYIKNENQNRIGFLIKGNPGVGKSLMIQVIASIYDMGIHIVTLNSENMSDSVLINLISNIPPRSLIVFDEFEKQLECLNENNGKLTTGGILQAMDGPQRISHKSIIILTVNDDNFLNEKFKNSLLRKGRIDECYNF